MVFQSFMLFCEEGGCSLPGGRLRAVCGGWFVTCDQELLCVIRSGSITARRHGALLAYDLQHRKCLNKPT